jgi:hypothetical protein
MAFNEDCAVLLVVSTTGIIPKSYTTVSDCSLFAWSIFASAARNNN